MVAMATCARCGAEHALLDPTFVRPDAYVQLDEPARRAHACASDDLCRLALPGVAPRWFVRCTLPIAVAGHPGGIAWGVWAEVDAADYVRIEELWDAADQADEPPLPATLANAIPGYTTTLGLPLRVRLTGPATRPEVEFTGASAHPFVRECRDGVDAHRAAQWTAGLAGPGAPADPDQVAVFVCSHVFEQGHPVLYVVHDDEGDWQFLCGGDHDDGPRVIALSHMLQRDPSLREVRLRLARCQQAERASPAAAWQCGPWQQDPA